MNREVMQRGIPSKFNRHRHLIFPGKVSLFKFNLIVAKDF